MNKIKGFIEGLSETTTLTKRELFLGVTACIFGGMVLGMFCSPKKRTMIGSHNGNHNGNNNGWEEDNEDDLFWEEESPEDEIISF